MKQIKKLIISKRIISKEGIQMANVCMKMFHIFTHRGNTSGNLNEIVSTDDDGVPLYIGGGKAK